MPSLDHFGLVLEPYCGEEELLHHDDRILGLARRDGRTQLHGRGVEALCERLCFLTQLSLELIAQVVFEELCGRRAYLQEKTGHFRVQLAPSRSIVPPLIALCRQLGWKAGVVLVVGNIEKVLHQYVWEDVSVDLSILKKAGD